MRFDSGVNDQWPGTSPMLVFREGSNSVHIVTGVRARIGHPEVVIQASGREGRIIDQYNKWKCCEVRRRPSRRKAINLLIRGGIVLP